MKVKSTFTLERETIKFIRDMAARTRRSQGAIIEIAVERLRREGLVEVNYQVQEGPDGCERPGRQLGAATRPGVEMPAVRP